METTQYTSIKTFQWCTLLNLAALGNLAVLLFMSLIQGDTLALILGAIILVGLALLRFRSGLLGILVLGLLFADIMIWTVSGAVNNLLHGEGGLTLLLPSFLGIISLVGLTAAAGMVINRRSSQEGSSMAAMVAKIGLGLLLVAAAASFLMNITTQDLPPAEIVLRSKNMVFSNSELHSHSGEVTVRLANDDLWWHTFTIDELGIDLQVPMGAERSVTFDAPPGEYRYYCGIPGHEALGMIGILTIEE
jgi:plastocyanin